MQRIADPPYASFPFRVGAAGASTSGRAEHVREQIEQVLFTSPRERVFRPEFGAGVRRLVFEPNSPGLREVLRRRLTASLAEALQGEVDPSTLQIEIQGSGERITIVVSYSLAAIGSSESHAFRLA